jgi:hypothetical protein
MFTKNFYSVLFWTLFDKDAPVKRTDGTEQSEMAVSRFTKATAPSSGGANYWNALMYKWASTINTEGIFFGTGKTTPTADDYKPENILGTGSISVANPSRITVNQTDDYVEAIVSFAVTNISSSTITISEIGCLGYLRESSTSYYTADSTHPPYLAERQLLETPITLGAGEAEGIQYRVRFSYGA